MTTDRFRYRFAPTLVRNRERFPDLLFGKA